MNDENTIRTFFIVCLGLLALVGLLWLVNHLEQPPIPGMVEEPVPATQRPRDFFGYQ